MGARLNMWPDLPKGSDMSIVENTTLMIQRLRPEQIDPLAITTPLLRWLSTVPNAVDLAKKAISCKRIENTSKRVEDAI